MSLYCDSPSALKEGFSTCYVHAAFKYSGCSSSVLGKKLLFSPALLYFCAYNLFRTVTVHYVQSLHIMLD